MRDANGKISRWGLALTVIAVVGVLFIFSYISEVGLGQGSSPSVAVEPTETPLAVFQTRRAQAAAREESGSVELNSVVSYTGPEKWEDNRNKKIRLSDPIPADTIIRITGPRFPDGSGYFSVWVLDEDQVKDQLLMSTTSSLDVENFRLRRDAYFFEVETTDQNLWKIQIDKLP